MNRREDQERNGRGTRETVDEADEERAQSRGAAEPVQRSSARVGMRVRPVRMLADVPERAGQVHRTENDEQERDGHLH